VLGAIAYLLRRQGRFEASEEKLQRAFRLNPRDASLAINLAFQNLMMREYDEAERFCDRVISLAPDLIVTYQVKAWNDVLWKGDTEKARVILESAPVSEDEPQYYHWFELDVLDRDYEAALDRLSSVSSECYEDLYRFIPLSQSRGIVYHFMGDGAAARSFFEEARIILEEKISEKPGDHRFRSALGIAYAGLGRREEALREGEKGLALLPVSKDAIVGPFRIEDLAFISTMAGEQGAAIDRIETLLSMPSHISVPLLRIDPKWDPLRGNPRFRKLLEK
jgi:serine/threonine-protein kinase